jgi:hypothetical protein
MCFKIKTFCIWVCECDPTEAIPQNNTATISLKKVFLQEDQAQIEAAAGSRLIKILNVRAGSWPSAFISNVKVWHWTRETTTPKERNVGVRLLNPFPIIPKAQLIEARAFQLQQPLLSFIFLKPFLPGRYKSPKAPRQQSK